MMKRAYLLILLIALMTTACSLPGQNTPAAKPVEPTALPLVATPVVPTQAAPVPSQISASPTDVGTVSDNLLKGIPILEGAANMTYLQDAVRYQSDSDLRHAQAFYDEQMGFNGWTLVKTDTSDPQATVMVFERTDGAGQATVSLHSTGSLTLVEIAVAQESAAEHALEATPTTDLAASGLPAEIGLAPGAVDLEIFPQKGLTYLVTTPFESVAKFYEAQFSGAGWTKGESTPGQGDTANQLWEKDKLQISVLIESIEAGTRVTILLLPAS